MRRILVLATALLSFSFFNVEAQEDVYRAKNFYHLLGMQGFSDNLLTMNFKLYEGYVKQTNLFISRLKELEKEGKVGSIEYVGIKRMFGFEYDGMRLHELYFENLGGKTPLAVKDALYQQIERDFDSFEAWKKDFMATGMIRGVGWALLYFDPHAKRLFNVWINEHQMNELAECKIILAMDVWEHAYITEYGIQRADYIDAFMRNIQWNIPSHRFSADL